MTPLMLVLALRERGLCFTEDEVVEVIKDKFPDCLDGSLLKMNSEVLKELIRILRCLGGK